jgi:gliding motility-associated-like protein
MSFNPDGSFTYTPKTDFVGSDSFTYQLCDKDGECNQATVTITVYDLVLPDQVFSPNGDGLNDTFFIEGCESYPNNKLQIFNRWGNLVYEKNGYKNDWDGYSIVFKIGNLPLPVGTYFYVFNYGTHLHKTGYVYLNR